MRAISVLGLVVLMTAGTASFGGAQKPTNPDKAEAAVEIRMPVQGESKEFPTPLLAVYVAPMSRIWHAADPADLDPQIIVAVWKDGRIIWSREPVRGGGPYREGKVEPGKVQKALDDLEKRGIFKDRSLRRLHFGPDADFTAIVVADSKRWLDMGSWHELFEESPKMVATDHGVEALEGRDRAKVLTSQPESYRNYRKAWSDAKATLLGLIPPEGKDAGKLRFRYRWLKPDSQD
jgi:hypothetical protein